MTAITLKDITIYPVVEHEAPFFDPLEFFPSLTKELLAAGMETVDYTLPAADGARLAWLYRHGEVVARGEPDAAGQVHVTVRLSPADRARFEQAEAG